MLVVLCFVFCVLCFVFCVLCFVFCALCCGSFSYSTLPRIPTL
jgi:hypothetical protein